MYHAKVTLATSVRVFHQLSHDPRTLALIFVVPCLLLALLRWVFDASPVVFDHVGPVLLGVFPFVLMFIVTSITTLRERRSGTLERVLTTPVGKSDLLFGYLLTFGFLAIAQAFLASALLLYVLEIPVAGPDWFLIVMALGDALLGAALGLFVSAFARTEFQAVQFMPAFVMPQVLIGGLFVPVDVMPDALQIIAYCLPMTYAIDALTHVTTVSDIPDEAWRDLWVVFGSALVAVLLGALTLRRQTK